MVSQKRQHSALIWRQAHDVFATKSEPRRVCWELIRDSDFDDYFFAVQHATVYRLAKGKWELRYFEGSTEMVTYHKTLTEAKAVGFVNIRFNQAEGK